jgi:hypothetical protein
VGYAHWCPVGAVCLVAIGCMAATPARGACGEVITLATHGRTTTSYSLALPPEQPTQAGAAALVLLPGGGGHLSLDAQGCPRKLTGNSLVRSRDLFHEAGFATALVDVPTDHRGTDGLGGFRLSKQHAQDIGKVIADVRRRTNLPVWLVGTSRGAISAANAAGRLEGESAPDGLILTSPVTSGRSGGRKSWVAQTTLGAPLEAIRMPVLVVAHAADACIRTPPARIGRITDRTNGTREQTVTVGRGTRARAPSVEACTGATPHGFLGQEADVAAGMGRFVRGGRY